MVRKLLGSVASSGLVTGICGGIGTDIREHSRMSRLFRGGYYDTLRKKFAVFILEADPSNLPPVFFLFLDVAPVYAAA